MLQAFEKTFKNTPEMNDVADVLKDNFPNVKLYMNNFDNSMQGLLELVEGESENIFSVNLHMDHKEPVKVNITLCALLPYGGKETNVVVQVATILQEIAKILAKTH